MITVKYNMDGADIHLASFLHHDEACVYAEARSARIPARYIVRVEDTLCGDPSMYYCNGAEIVQEPIDLAA